MDRNSQKEKKKDNHTKKNGAKPVLARALSLADKRWLLFGLVVFTFILYGNSIMHDYALDDDLITQKNEYVQDGFKGIPKIFKKGYLYGFNKENGPSYRPLVLADMAIEKQIWGNSPHINHLFNVLWYALTGIFLFLVLLKIFRQYHFIVPLLITLLFLAHPVHTEVVANIKSRDEILSFLFCIISLYFILDYYYLNKRLLLFLSLLFYFMALLSKENTLAFAMIIPLVFYFFTGASIKKIVSLSLPFVAPLALYMALRASILDSVTLNEKMSVINNTLVAAHSGSVRLATIVFILGKYLGLLVFPHPLSWDYSYNQIPVVNWSNIWVIVSLLLYTGLGIYAFIGLKKKEPVAFCIFYFMVTMLLVSNLFISIGSSMGERFLYTPSLGFCIAIAFILLRALKIDIAPKQKKVNFTAIYGVAGVVLLAYAFKTIDRNADWENNFVLCASGVNTSPNSARTHESLAYQYTEKAKTENGAQQQSDYYQKAIDEYNRTLAILPNYAEGWYNLGYTYMLMGNDDGAKKGYLKCVEIEPKYAKAYNNLAFINFNEKQFNEAIKYYLKYIELNPASADIYANVGACYHNMGQYQQAVLYYQKALDINPGLANVRENMAKATAKLTQ